MNILYKIALAVTIIGAVNWGFVGLFDVNLVSLLFGVDSIVTNVVYVLVGLCGLVCIGLLLTPFDEEHHK
jgi:hypothetical protein